MSSTNSAFETLNAAQRDAVMHGEPRSGGGIQASPLLVIAGILLLGAWLFFIRSTFSSMGTVGVVLLLALFAAIVWWLVARGWLSTADKSTMAWVVLTCLGLLLGIGMSWAHIRARISGQASVDRVDQ